MQLNIAKEQQAVWMDGHRLVANSDGRIFVFDFDGANAQNLVSSIPALNAYFDRDYEFVQLCSASRRQSRLPERSACCTITSRIVAGTNSH